MPGPEQVIRAFVTLPVTVGLGIGRRVAGILGGLLPHEGDEPPVTAYPPGDDVGVAIAADDAMTRDRDPVEEAPLVPDDDLSGHIEPEVEVVAESADEDTTESPGGDVHVDEAVRDMPRTPSEHS
jgi:hypothetical protein